MPFKLGLLQMSVCGAQDALCKARNGAATVYYIVWESL